MRYIFADTSAWDALADSADAHHAAALAFMGIVSEQCRFVVTNYILDELYTLLLMNIGYQSTITFKRRIDVLVQAGIIEVVWVSKQIETEAWSIFERFNVDKRWSFTDCVSYVVMKQRNIAETFAFDHHFEQMGFVRLP